MLIPSLQASSYKPSIARVRFSSDRPARPVVLVKPIATPRRNAALYNPLTAMAGFLGGTQHVTGFARNGPLFWDLARNFRKRFPLKDKQKAPVFVAGGSDMREVPELGLCLAAQEPNATFKQLAEKYPVTAVEINPSLVERARQGVFELRMAERYGISRLLDKGGSPLQRLWHQHLTPVDLLNADDPSATVQPKKAAPSNPLAMMLTAMFSAPKPQVRGDQLIIPPQGEGLQASDELKGFMGDSRQGDMFDLEKHMPKRTSLVLLRNSAQYHADRAFSYFKQMAERMAPNGLICLGDSDLSALSTYDPHVEALRGGLIDAGFRPLSREECAYNYDGTEQEGQSLNVPVVYERQ